MTYTSLTSFAGRFFLSFIFLASAFSKVNNFDSTTQLMADHGMPAAGFLCVMAILFEVFGGLSVLLGFYARWGAGVLIFFLIPTTLIFHLGPDQRIQLFKNVAIIGGLFQVVAFGSGEWSLDFKSHA